MSAFTDSIGHYCQGLTVAPGPSPGCDECGLSDYNEMDCPEYDVAQEPNFSSAQCDSCGSTFGGDRLHAHGLPIDEHGRMERDKDIIHLTICVDCLMFHANGDEPETWTQHPGG